ncbi:MAG TPA: hypothetical protein DCS93_07445 [Microscillaceae bacterium]|nr:hypothetical protein [Microscillaceae bacterium]
MRIIEPDKRLKTVVRQFWYLEGSSLGHNRLSCKILADGTPGIIFQHNREHSAVVNETNNYLPLAFAYGQSTQPCFNEIIGTPFIFGVNFQPNAFKALFAIDTSELTNAILEIEYLLGASFQEQLLEATHPSKVAQLFNEALLQKLVQFTPMQMMDESIRLILGKLPEIDPKKLASHFNISRRQFQRKFKAYVGVCPETYIRIVKFQHAINLLRQGRYQKLSDVGYMLNYADQSHFNREFKRFSGDTPKKFLETKAKPQPFLQANLPTYLPLRIVHY